MRPGGITTGCSAEHLLQPPTPHRVPPRVRPSATTARLRGRKGRRMSDRLEGSRTLASPRVSTLPSDRPRHVPAEVLRGRLFTDLDRLAFAIEIEAAEALERGDEALAVRLEERRLGVRLAQRLVAGVHADEVDLRIERFRREYDLRVNGNGA